jgi:hypothetical protein
VADTCSTCAHWSDRKWIERRDLRACGHPFLTNCGADIIANTVPDFGAAVMDNQGWYAHLFTGPEFGCVNHSRADVACELCGTRNKPAEPCNECGHLNG